MRSIGVGRYQQRLGRKTAVTVMSQLPVPLEEVWVRSVLLSLEGDVCCGAWCTWIAWTGTC